MSEKYDYRTAQVEGEEYKFANAFARPFVLEGFPWKAADGPIRRLPESISEEETNAGIMHHAQQSSGGAVRFRTDSGRIAVKAFLYNVDHMSNTDYVTSAGFDLYRGRNPTAIHVGTAVPVPGKFEVECRITASGQPGKMYDWTLNLPNYGNVSSLEIGFAPEAAVEPPVPHTAKPVLFYGSSITQGASASRPGLSYSARLCRALDAEQINLGFSGSARGEPAIAKLIASLDLSAFVMDYDHNAPTPEHLLNTHEPFFRIIREAKPELPVIMLSRPDFWSYDPGSDTHVLCVRRRSAVRATYERAISAGDRHVYFVDGESLFGEEDRCECSVDGCHPNDLGFQRMYKTVLPVLRRALQGN